MSSDEHLRQVQQRAAPYGIRVSRSPNARKKYRAYFKDGLSADFGAAGYSDYIEHGDEARRQRYHARAGAVRLLDGRLAVTVPGTPAWLSYHLLW